MMQHSTISFIGPYLAVNFAPKAKVSPAGGGVGGGEHLTPISYFSFMDANKANQFGYNKELQPYANSLRKEMTKAEACLWKYVLRAGSMMGYSFRRQRPVLKYIADFMCPELMLIIEVDGLTHNWDETIVRDQAKEAALKNAGFTILRFTDSEVLSNINVVRLNIEDWIKQNHNSK